MIMRIKNWYILIVVLIFCSCDTFIIKKENRNDIKKEERLKLTTSEIEEYPLFENCELVSRHQYKTCFETTISDHILKCNLNQNIAIKSSLKDTLWVEIRITNEGILEIEKLRTPNHQETKNQELQDWLDDCFSSLPSLEPAHTLGTPVSTKFDIPLVFSPQ